MIGAVVCPRQHPIYHHAAEARSKGADCGGGGPGGHCGPQREVGGLLSPHCSGIPEDTLHQVVVV